MRALVLLTVAGCGFAEEGPDSAACGPSWEDAVEPFTVTYCDACHASTTAHRHGAPLTVTFDDEDEAVRWADRIVARVVAGEMPPGGGVSEAEVAALEAWASCAL